MADKGGNPQQPAKKASFKAEDLFKMGAKPPDSTKIDESAAPVAGDEAVRNLKEPKKASTVLAIIAVGLFLLGILVMLFNVPAGLLLWVFALGVAVFAALTFFLYKKGEL